MLQLGEFFLFAGIMIIAVVIFSFMAMSYEYNIDELEIEFEEFKQISPVLPDSSSLSDEAKEMGEENRGGFLDEENPVNDVITAT